MILNMFHEKLPSVRDFLRHRNKVSSFYIKANHSRRSQTFNNWIIKTIQRSDVCIVLFSVYSMSTHRAQSKMSISKSSIFGQRPCAPLTSDRGLILSTRHLSLNWWNLISCSFNCKFDKNRQRKLDFLQLSYHVLDSFVEK